jgi:hypothetical protein
MFSLTLSVGLSIILNAMNFEILAPFQALFLADVGKQVMMDVIDANEVINDIFDAVFDTD